MHTVRLFKTWPLATILIILSILCIFGLSGCGSDTANAGPQKKTVTVTTSFLDDMVHQLAGDTVNVQEIIPAGEDPHRYVAKPQDLQKIKNADLVLYHGLHFEGKMQDALKAKGVAVTKDFKPDQVGHMDLDGKETTDPHFWFNIDLYKQAVQTTAQELIKLEPDKKEMIEKNEKEYLAKLDALAAESKAKLATIPPDQRYLITPHDAFNYFSRYYGIPVMAPQGVSTDSEVANADIQKTVDFIVKHHVKAIFAESTTDPARMKKLQEAAAAKGWHVDVVSGKNEELFSDSLAPKGEPGDTYITMYQHNIDLITNHLK